ncbi:hypothetical protein Tco_1342397, partial [Tanacetum coccineum]
REVKEDASKVSEFKKLAHELLEDVRRRRGYIRELKKLKTNKDVIGMVELLQRMQKDDREKAAHLLLMANETKLKMQDKNNFILKIRGHLLMIPACVRNDPTFSDLKLLVIDHEKLDELQRNIILILCQLEMYFPPSFFDVMVHLMSHIVEEIKLAGRVFLRYMYPFERYMGFLKGYVRNRYRPEGSIVQGYAAEEVVQFCTNYMDNVADIGLSQPRHQVLKNMTCIEPYIHEHMSYLAENNSRRDQRWLEAEHKRTFSQWLADKVIRMSPTNVDTDVIQLGYRPRRVLQYQGYDINGYTFYTEQQDDKSTVQNSGVTLIATTTDSSRMTIAKNSYYGVVDEIWELDYTSVVIPLLKCKWVNNTRGVKVDSDGFTCVNLSTNGYLSDPFILAKQATQVFYVKDPKDKRWHIVLQSKRSIVGVDDVVDEDEYNKFDELPPFSIGVQSTDDVLSDTLYLRSDHQEGHED